MKISAAILVAFMLLVLPAAASGLVEGGEQNSYDDGAGNDALVLSAEGEVAPSGEVTAAPTDVSITANREHLVRNNDFCVTIRGESKKQYSLFIEDAGISDAGYPLIKVGQPSVEIIGDAPFPAAPAAAIANEKRAGDGVHFPDQTAALVQIDVNGARTVGLTTSSYTTPRSFSITVIDPEDENRVDTVGVTVEEGEVTITAEGCGTYYLGEEIKLSGTNTDTDEVFLFMTGWNLGNSNGVSLEDLGLKTDLDIDGAVRCDVESDDTWEYRWDTSAIKGGPLDQSTYTVYAVSKRENTDGLVGKANLDDVKYQTIGLYLKEPTLTLDDGVSRIAGGDALRVSGYAEGDPDRVLIWIIGKECPAFGVGAPVQCDGSFEYILGTDMTADLSGGQYFVVVQHPRYDGVFNVCPDPAEGTPYQVRDGAGNLIDLGDRLPSDAVATLLSAIKGPGSDDLHAETSFTLDEDGITVAVEGAGTFVLGDEVTISGTNAGSEQVYLFLTGGNLGDGVAPDDLGAAASEGNYVVCEVAADDTWEYRWDTAALRGALTVGTYTLYAADRGHDLDGHAVDRSHLDGVRNATATLTLKRPTLTSSLNRSAILNGEALAVSGTATGSPGHVCIWILGDDAKVPGVSVPVREDGTYEYVLGAGDTAALSEEVRVLVQHPMMDHVFNTCPAPEEGKPYQIRDAEGNLIDLGPLSASEAEDVFVRAMALPGSDDCYYPLSITVGAHGVTAAFEGNGSYAIGDTITFSGTAADTETVYLFVDGPNHGGGCPPDNLGVPASDGRYGVCEVAADGTWEYQWDTSSTVMPPDSGTYTLYVAATDHDLYGHSIDAAHLHGVRHAAVDVFLHVPTLTAALDHSSLRQGDALLISGAATGSPDALRLWIFGANARVVGAPVPVADDGTFEYVLGAEETTGLEGLYSLVVQHPGGSCAFDVNPDPVEGKPYQIKDTSGNAIDLGILSAPDAASTFVAALDSPYSDDLYANLTVAVEAAEGEEWIRIDQVEDAYRGERVVLTGTTTLAAGMPLSLEVASRNSVPTDKSGISDEVTVQEGTPFNTWSYAFDTSDWPLGECTVKVTSQEHALSRLGTFVLQYGSLDVACAPAPVAPGKTLTISGNATGGAENVSVWIIGKDYLKVGEAVPVGADETFAYSLTTSETKKLSGKYSVVVQHPMADGVFNVRPTTVCDNPFWIVTATGGECNLSRLSAGDAVAALTGALDSIYSDDRYQVLTFEVKAAEESQEGTGNGGSRGGGGGGAPPRPPAQPVPQVIEKIGSAYLEADVNGTVETMTVVLTVEKRGSLSLDVGVTALDLFGRPLEKVSAAQVSAASLPETDDASLRQVGPGLKCGPDRATFDPAVEICFTLTEDEWESLGAGEEFVVRWYNPKTGAWEPLRTKVDPGTRQVIARTSHFSTFAVFAEPAAAAPSETVAVTKTASAGGQEMAPDDEGQTEVPPTSAGPAPWMSVVGAGAALVLARVTSGFWKRR